MLFNSLEFLLFFPAVALVYFLLPKVGWKNLFLLLASFYFYMNWKPMFALLLLGSIVVTYGCGFLLEKNAEYIARKKWILTLSLVLNFGCLFVFKYFNFFNGAVRSAFQYLGIAWTVPNLDILLPVGISFYTFMAVGYCIDVYRGTIKAERNFITYALYVSFFPQICAGPIGRAKDLIPQFKEKRAFRYDKVSAGVKMMLWGYFMKLCIADQLCVYVDAVFNNIPHHNGTTIAFASLLFTIQIYCDFAGYSLIAIGTAKTMGIDLMENFHRPYFSTSMKEFWKRWHISLSSWFMEYLYFPLGGNRVPYWRNLTNLMIVFLVSGIWHGANWTFILWGALHGLFVVSENVWTKIRGKHTYTQWYIRLPKILVCFVLASFAWMFFRANSISDVFMAIEKMFTESGSLFFDRNTLVIGLASALLLLVKDMVDEYNLKLRLFNSKMPVVRYASFVILLSFVLMFGAMGGGQFIYFQF